MQLVESRCHSLVQSEIVDFLGVSPRDNTQLQVDGILYFQVTDPMRASYGSSNYVTAITQLAQTMLRSVIGKMELDKTFEERESINGQVVSALDEAASNWGVKVLRYV